VLVLLGRLRDDGAIMADGSAQRVPARVGVYASPMPVGRLPEPQTAPLLALDPELGAALSDEALAAARRHALVPTLRLPAGTWRAPQVGAVTGRPFAAVVIEGVVVREVLLGGTVASELVGPGDVVDLGAPGDEALVPVSGRWTTAETALVAVLGDDLLPALRGWPSLAAALVGRAARRAARVEVQRGISQLPRVEDRLVALLGHLAERFGRVTGDGVVVPVGLTHEMLGRLVGARRPTVSLALKHLDHDGAVVRRGDGAWLLAPGALDHLATPEQAAPHPGEAAAIALPPEVVAPAAGITAEDVRRMADRCARLRAHTEVVRDRSRTTIARSVAMRSRMAAGGPDLPPAGIPPAGAGSR
jgi:CRP/FNR family cyclic AMP-dependent transcriptional regulator